MRETARVFLDAEALTEVRRNTDWAALLAALGIAVDPRRSKADDIWAHSPFTEDRRASFHVTPKGWYCFSIGEGGGALELVQRLRSTDCYGAARWLLENGLSRYAGEIPAAGLHHGGAAADGAAEKPVNRPIRQDLLPLLDSGHPELVRRGLSPETCAYLGCGYLPAGGRSPLCGRIVFQVRGVREGKPVILTHIGRALSEAQEEADGKWHHYKGFVKTQELYNSDHLLLDPQAVRQAQASGRILLVEGCFDAAKLIEAGILSAGATFGPHLDPEQLPRLKEIAAATGVGHFRVFYDRDKAGRAGQDKAIALINSVDNLTADGFDWEVTFPSPARGAVRIPDTLPDGAPLSDPADLTVEQLRFLREQGAL
jgi:hypothetical protein